MEENRLDICYHCGGGSDEVDFFIHLKKELLKYGLTSMVFSLNPLHAIEWEKKGMRDYVILPDYKGKVNIDWAADFVKNLGILNFRSLFQTEQIFYDLSEKYCLERMARYVYAVEKLKNTPKARFYFTYGGDEFDHNAFRLFSRMQNGRTIYTQAANMKGRIVLFENEDRYWQIPKVVIPEPENRELQELRQYINDYLSNKTILWGDPSARDIKWEWSYPIRFLKRLNKSWGMRKIYPQRTNFYKSRIYLERIFNRTFAKKYYSNSKPFIYGEEPFIYFPLHYPKDSQLTLRGKPFLNQVSIVETVSRYVPYPITLLVKEHPHARGWYPINDIKKISSLPNVKLIHPFTNSHLLIPKSRGIVAINSSVGYEAIMYRKPVIAMGHSFYRCHGITIDINSLYELEEAFEKLELFSVEESDVLNFLWKVKYFSFESENLFDKSKENAFNIALAISTYLNNIKKSRF